MGSKIILLNLAFILLMIEIDARNNRKTSSSHIRIEFNNAIRNRRQSGYQYDKPKISFDLPNNRGTKPSDQSMNGYPSGQPKASSVPEKSPNLSASGYPKNSPPTNSLSPVYQPQSGDSFQSGGYPSDKPKGNTNSISYDAPTIDAASKQPDTKYISPDSSAAPPISSTRGPEYLPPKPPSDSYTPNENPGKMVIVVADVPQSIDTSTPGSKYLPPFSPNRPSSPGSPPQSGPPKSKYVPPPDDLPLPAAGQPPSSSYVPPNSGGSAPGGGSASPQTPNTLYNGPDAISSPASTYLPPYQ